MGSTGANTSGAGSTSITIFQDGPVTIEFDEPLVYSNTKQSIPSKAEKGIREFEAKHINSKTEYSYFVTDDGKVVESNHGGKKTVSASAYARLNSDLMTHNHPSVLGGLGGSFSADKDLYNFVNYKQHMYRAAAKEGVYVISKTPAFTKEGGKEFVKQATEFSKPLLAEARKYRLKLQKQAQAEANIIYADKSLTSKERSAKINKLVTDANIQLYKKQNPILIKIHNWYRDNAGKYGMIYGLEKH